MRIQLQSVASLGDRQKTAMLAREIWHEHYDPLIGSSQVDYMLKNFQSEQAIAGQIAHGTVYLLALWDGEAVGYCAYRVEEEKVFLSKVYVKRSARGRGIGKVFFDAVETCARGKRSVYLTVNKHNSASIDVYKKVGYVVADEVKTDIGQGYVMDDYIMEKQLA